MPLEHPPLHPYIEIWAACRRYGNGLNGSPCFPQAGAYFDQDAELMLAFDLLTTMYAEIEAAKDKAQQAQLNRQNNQAPFSN